VSIQFNFDIDDVAASYHLHWTTCAECKKARILRCMSLFGSMLLGILIASLLMLSWVILLVGLGLLLLGFLLRPKLSAQAMREAKKAEKSLAGNFGICEMTVNPEGVSGKWSTGSMLQKWAAISEIHETADHVVFSTGHSYMMTLPKKKIRAGDFDQFMTEAREHRRRALSSSQPETTDAD
jgi:hypothetical protein